MSKPVTYCPEEGRHIDFVILKEHDDKTVDVGPEGGPVAVSNCPLSETQDIGTATLKVPEKAPTEKSK